MSAVERQTSENNLPLCEHHIQCILQSGLLLEENFDCVLDNCEATVVKSEDKKLNTLKNFVGVISLSTSLIVIRQKYNLLWVTLSASPIVLFGLRKLKELIDERRRKYNVEKVINTMKDMSRLNCMILKYFKAKNYNESTVSGGYDLYTKHMKKFMEIIFHEEVTLLREFRIIIQDLGDYVPFIKMDFAYLDGIDLDAFSSFKVACIEDCIKFIQEICDIYVLLVSSCFTCMCIVLSPNIMAEFCINSNEIINTIVPKMKNIASTCFDKTNKAFDDLRFHYLKNSEIKKQLNNQPVCKSNNRLKMGMYSTLALMSNILDKSQDIFNVLPKMDLEDSTEKETLAEDIYVLRRHVLQYYEQLDLLYNVFQVDIHGPENVPPVVLYNVAKETKDPVPDASLNVIDPRDEEYELFIGADEPTTDPSYSYHDELESHKLATLLGQELRLKLKANVKFIAAREKRGIIDEKPERKAALDLIPSPSGLDEGLGTDRSGGCNAHASTIGYSTQDSGGTSSRPPPPPPPLPLLDLGDGDPDNFTASIRAASRRRGHLEDVFGDD